MRSTLWRVVQVEHLSFSFTKADLSPFFFHVQTQRIQDRCGKVFKFIRMCPYTSNLHKKEHWTHIPGNLVNIHQVLSLYSRTGLKKKWLLENKQVKLMDFYIFPVPNDLQTLNRFLEWEFLALTYLSPFPLWTLWKKKSKWNLFTHLSLAPNTWPSC